IKGPIQKATGDGPSPFPEAKTALKRCAAKLSASLACFAAFVIASWSSSYTRRHSERLGQGERSSIVVTGRRRLAVIEMVAPALNGSSSVCTEVPGSRIGYR